MDIKAKIRKWLGVDVQTTLETKVSSLRIAVMTGCHECYQALKVPGCEYDIDAQNIESVNHAAVVADDHFICVHTAAPRDSRERFVTDHAMEYAGGFPAFCPLADYANFASQISVTGRLRAGPRR